MVIFHNIPYNFNEVCHLAWSNMIHACMASMNHILSYFAKCGVDKKNKQL